MNSKMQILNWLYAAHARSPYSLNESFYFDKLEKRFFSVMAIDYFMLDENLELAEGITVSYSENELNELLSYIQKIEKKDSNILSIVPISPDKRKEMINNLLDMLSNEEEIENIKSQIDDDYKSTFNQLFTFNSTKENLEKWEVLKSSYIREVVDSYLNLNAINIDGCSIMEFSETSHSIKTKLDKEEEDKPIVEQAIVVEKKKWWQIWK